MMRFLHDSWFKLALLALLAAPCCFLCRWLEMSGKAQASAAADIHSAVAGINRVTAGIDKTIVNLNRPCKGPAGPDACGTLAQINKTSIAIGDIANASARSVQQSSAVLKQTQATLQGIASDVHGEMAALEGTTGAAMAFTEQARKDLVTLDGTLQSATGAVDHIGDLAADPDIKRGIKAGADLTEQAAGIAGDTHKVTTHLEQKIDNPKPMGTGAKLKLAWSLLWQLAMLAK